MSFLSKNLSAILLSALVIRVCYLGSSVGEALAILALSGLLGYYKYLSHKEIKDPTQELRNEILELRRIQKDDMDTLRGEVTKMSISSTVRPVKSNNFKF